jgi:hypothetical protein
MKSRLLRPLLLALLLAPPAFCQFELYSVDGNVERLVPPVLELGSVYPGETASVRLRLRNTSSASVSLNLLSADGAGFTISGKPALPLTMPSQASVEFTVEFRANGTGTYSAALYSQGVSVLLTAMVLPRLTWQVETPAGPQTLGSPGIDFGSVPRGGNSNRHILVENRTELILTVPAITVTGAGFSVGSVPSGQIMMPRQTAGFDIQFLPLSSGPAGGQLIIGDRSYGLTASVPEPPLPKPLLSIDRERNRLAVSLDAASQTSGSGIVTLAFQGPPDPAIQFAAGSRSLRFTVSAGDTQGHFGDDTGILIQTGTTAGRIVLTATLGGVSDVQSIVIEPAPVRFTSVEGVRSPGAMELRISGFDNTRTAGKIVYSFFDASGNRIAPGAIEMDNTAGFAAYFQQSESGGAFVLRSIFPVTGDVFVIAAFEVRVENSIGAGITPRTRF